MKISKDAIKIGQAMTAGVLLEVSCHPSPGLVSPYSMGAHKDMNFMSFLLSTSAISPYFSLFAQMGIDWDRKESLLGNLRPIGKEAEEELLQITGGVNTQRGILFLGGIIAAASGVAIKDDKVNIYEISKNVAEICKGIVETELKTLKSHPKNTNGEKLFLHQGITGIRGEVEEGLPSITEIAYPQFVRAIDSQVGLKDAMVDTLLHLMALVEDTTVLSRLGIEGLRKTHIASKEVIKKGSVYTKDGKRALEDLNKYFIGENISPGGCADLLAVTVGIYILEGNEISLKNILKV
ncbi:MAG: triphosphoribosyl-dephospho-CoA synthase [Clostridiaceae bacterium]|nr:triphosphoribosyl-dephospho-CoA synthase [Clostridiaceae bacterium]